MRLWRTEGLFILGLALAILVPGCQKDLGLEDKHFACESTDQCASGYTCVDQICQGGSLLPDAGSAGDAPSALDTSTTDTGTTDTGTPPVDEGAPPVDEGTPPVDEGTPPVDEGTPPVDEGTPPADEGTPPVDEGTPPADEGTPPVDEGSATDEGQPSTCCTFACGGPAPQSCNQINSCDSALISGHYTIDPDGTEGVAPFVAWCDMDPGNGGWTLIARYKGGGDSVDWEGYIFNPYAHQTQIPTVNFLNSVPSLSPNGEVFGHIRYTNFEADGATIKMECGSPGNESPYSFSSDTVFQNFSSGDKGSVGSEDGWGFLGLNSVRSNHLLCGNSGPDPVEGAGGIAYCLGPGAAFLTGESTSQIDGFFNHRVSFNAWKNAHWFQDYADFPVGCDGQYLAGGIVKVWHRAPAPSE